MKCFALLFVVATTAFAQSPEAPPHSIYDHLEIDLDAPPVVVKHTELVTRINAKLMKIDASTWGFACMYESAQSKTKLFLVQEGQCPKTFTIE